MVDLDRQFEYWNTVGSEKSFAHPLKLDRVQQTGYEQIPTWRGA